MSPRVCSLACLALASVALAADPPNADPAKPVEVKPADAKPGAARLGIAADPLPAAEAKSLGLGKDTGLVVTDVKANSPAAKAGLKKGDVLAEVGGKPVPSDPAALGEFLNGLPQAEALPAVAYRDLFKTKLTVGPLDPAPRVAGKVAGKLDNPPMGRNKLDNAPASEGTTNFSAFATEYTQDGFQMFASGEGLRYDIRGRFRNGKAIPTAIKITDDGKVVAEVASLDKVPAGHRKAVDFMLGSFNKK